MQKNKLRKISAASLLLVGTLLFSSNNKILNIAPANAAAVAVQPPVFNQFINQTLPAGSGIGMSISATSPSGLPVTITFSGPQGAYFDATTNTFGWGTTTNDVGTHVVTFTASDGINTVTKSITITVTAPPTTTPPAVQPPVVQPPVVQPPVVKPPVVQPPTTKPLTRKDSVKKSSNQKMRTSDKKSHASKTNSNKTKQLNNKHSRK